MKKVCSKCGDEQDIDQFYPKGKGTGKFRAQCKTCLSKRAANYYIENKEHIYETVNEYRETNRELYLEGCNKRRLRHADVYNQRACDWAKENPERHRAKRRRYYQSHSESEREKRRQYGKLHPEKSQEHHGLRRARKLNNGHERVNIRLIWERDGGICYLCNQSVMRNEIHYDHVIPLSRGGPHTMDNIKVTHKSCNLHKSASTVEEYLARRKET